MQYVTLPLRLPGLFLKSVVYRLSNGRLHEVDVADDLRCKYVTQMAVKVTAVQTLYIIIIIIIIIRWSILTQCATPQSGNRVLTSPGNSCLYSCIAFFL